MSQKNKKTDVCYVISHGFAARMLLQTGLIRQLTEAGKRVAIITPDAEDENLANLKNNPLIDIYNPDINLTIWDDDYGVKRMYFLEDIRNNTVLWERHINSIFYTKSIHPWKRIRPFIYYPIHRLIKYFPGIRTRFKRREKKYLRSKKASELLKQINPSLVVSTYPVNFLEGKFLYAAKQQGISTLIHLLSWDNITSKGIFPVIPDRFILWGPIMAEELKAYYNTPDENTFVCGVPHFDQHTQIKENPDFRPLLEQLGLSPDRPYLFFAMSSPRFAPREIDIVERLAALIHKNKWGESLQLIIRPHPQNVQTKMADLSWIARLDALKSERVAIDYPQLNNSKVRWSMKPKDMHHLSNLLAGCSICMNSGSTVSIDALVMGKPVILTSFDGDAKLKYGKSARRLIDYPHQRKFVDMGGVSVVESYEALTEAIKKYIDDPSYNLDERQYTLNRECFQPDDGQATQRVVATMRDILHQIEADNA